MKPKNLVIASAVLLILAFVAGAYYYSGQQAQQAAQLAAKNQTVLLRSHSPTFGNANAPVQIVEFLDPACGTCRDFYPLVKSMMASEAAMTSTVLSETLMPRDSCPNSRPTSLPTAAAPAGSVPPEIEQPGVAAIVRSNSRPMRPAAPITAIFINAPVLNFRAAPGV